MIVGHRTKNMFLLQIEILGLVLAINPLSPTIHIQILLTDLHTFSYSISWENLLKDQSNFLLVVILLILVICSVDYVLIW